MSNALGSAAQKCIAAVLWIDWYQYHVERFAGLQEAFGCDGQVRGVEFVGGAGVHTGLTFRAERQAGLPVDTLEPDMSWGKASKWRLAVSVWRWLSKVRPELVLVPGYYTVPALAAACWARMHGRHSMLMTESTAGDHPRRRLREACKGALLRMLFDSAVCGGAAHLRYLEQLGFPSDRVAFFYDVVGNEGLQASVERCRATDVPVQHDLPERYFLFVGRLAPEKNVAGLLRAWLQYRAEGGTWSLVLAGEGPERSKVEEAIASSPAAAHVHLPGHRSAEQLVPCFAFASAFVLPSTREPWGLVVNEAMAAGLPVLVSNRCGCAEDLVEPGMTGMIFDPAYEAELPLYLHALERLPAGSRTQMGVRGHARIAAYSPQRFGMEVEQMFRRLPKRSLWQERASSQPVANGMAHDAPPCASARRP